MRVGDENGRTAAAAWRMIRPAIALIGALLVLGALGILVPAAAAEEAMSFRLLTIAGKGGCPRDCSQIIAAEGAIDNDTADRFVSFLADNLQDHDLRPLVLLESPGGTVLGAMQLGSAFRQIGAGVMVASVVTVGDGGEALLRPGACFSACVYAFVGGAQRVIPPSSWLGIHRMVINESVLGLGGEEKRETFGPKELVDALAAYTRDMGVDPRMIAYAETIAPEQLHILTRREMARWRLGRQRR